MHDALIFDLDGTLWDTSASCAIAWNNVLGREGIRFRTITEHDVRAVTGLSHEGCIRRAFDGLPEAQLLKIIDATILEDNQMIAKHGGDLFIGVVNGITALSERYPLYIVSNCQAGYIETFLAFSKLERCFRDFECWGNTSLSKTENLARLIARNNLQRPLFIGDMESDQIAARENKVRFAWVKYGFGTCRDADMRFDTFDALAAHLLGA